MRGYDAVHCASAEQLDDDEVVAAAADQRLLTAWLELGMATYDTNQRATPANRACSMVSALVAIAFSDANGAPNVA